MKKYFKETSSQGIIEQLQQLTSLTFDSDLIILLLTPRD